MKIINKDERYSLFCRIFNPGDLLCWVGIQEVTLSNNTGIPEAHTFPKGSWKIEIRHQDMSGKPIQTPGPVYSNNTQFTFSDDQIIIDSYAG